MRDITGQRFGKLVAVRFVGMKDTGKYRKSFWEFRCDCGRTKEISANNAGRSAKSCGCSKVGIFRVDLTGHRFGKVAVLRREGKNWLCKCDCGKEFLRNSQKIHTERLKSCGCIRNLPEGIPSRNRLFASMKYGAQKRNYEWRLTMEQFSLVTKEDCFYCGSPPKVTSVTRDDSGYLYNGIDRVDNSIGYIAENIVPCCKFCNIAKNNNSIGDFRDWVIRAYGYWARNPNAHLFETPSPQTDIL